MTPFFLDFSCFSYVNLAGAALHHLSRVPEKFWGEIKCAENDPILPCLWGMCAHTVPVTPSIEQDSQGKKESFGVRNSMFSLYLLDVGYYKGEMTCKINTTWNLPNKEIPD